MINIMLVTSVLQDRDANEKIRILQQEGRHQLYSSEQKQIGSVASCSGKNISEQIRTHLSKVKHAEAVAMMQTT